MRTLTPAERRAFRAKAHHLNPVVIVGHHGLTPPVLREIDIALKAHELVKIRVFSDDRDEREALLARICDGLDAAAVQHLGKILTVWRPAPEPEAPVAKPRGKRPAGPGKPKREEPRGSERRRSAAPPAPRGTSRTIAPADPRARRRKPAPLGNASGKRGGSAPPAGGRTRAHGPAPGARRRRTPR